MNQIRRVAIPVPTSGDFEYNRRSWPMYAEAVRQAGGTPVQVDLSLSERDLMAVARGCQGVLLPGSPADVNPQRYGQEAVKACGAADGPREATDRILLEEAYGAAKPVLGVCYGVQSLNVWRGGTLLQDLGCKPVNHSAGASVAVAHFVSVRGGGTLDRLADAAERVLRAGEVRLPVNSSHHQSVDRLGEGLRVAALSSEDGVIEAVEGTDEVGAPDFVLGVQWHPERSLELSGTSRAIFRAFLEAVIACERSQLSAREP